MRKGVNNERKVFLLCVRLEMFRPKNDKNLSCHEQIEVNFRLPPRIRMKCVTFYDS
jgi:hypothetical protein